MSGVRSNSNMMADGRRTRTQSLSVETSSKSAGTARASRERVLRMPAPKTPFQARCLSSGRRDPPAGRSSSTRSRREGPGKGWSVARPTFDGLGVMGVQAADHATSGAFPHDAAADSQREADVGVLSAREHSPAPANSLASSAGASNSGNGVPSSAKVFIPVVVGRTPPRIRREGRASAGDVRTSSAASGYSRSYDAGTFNS